MAGFSFANFALNIETMLQQLPTVQATQAMVYIGPPESFATRIGAFITFASATPDYTAMGLRTREARLLVTFGYRVGGNERAAELAIAELIDEFTATIAADPTLGGTVDDATTLDMSRADTPDYQGRAGSEIRAYPIMVMGHQQMEDPL